MLIRVAVNNNEGPSGYANLYSLQSAFSATIHHALERRVADRRGSRDTTARDAAADLIELVSIISNVHRPHHHHH